MIFYNGLPRRLMGALAICLAVSLWAVDAIVLMPSLYNLPLGFVVFIVHFFPFLLMQPFALRQYQILLKKMPKKDYFWFFLLAILGGFLGTFCISKALFLLHFQQLTIVTFLQKLQPIFALLLAKILLKEKFSARLLPWIILSLFSSYFLTFGWRWPLWDETMAQAGIYAVCAAACYGSTTVIGKKLTSDYSAFSMLFLRYGFTTFLLGAYHLFASPLGEWFGMMTQENWTSLLIIGCSSGGLSLMLYYYGLRQVKASVATVCELCFVLSAAVLDFWLHDTHLSLIQWTAAAGLLFAIYQITRKKI